INLRPVLSQQQVQQKTEDLSKNKSEEQTGNREGNKKEKELEKKQFSHHETRKKDIRKEGRQKAQVKQRGTGENKKSKEKTVEEKKTHEQTGVSKKTTGSVTVQTEKGEEKGIKSPDKGAIFSKGTLINLRTTFKELKKELASLSGQGTNQTLDLKELLLKTATAAPASSDPAMSYPVTREQRILANLVTGEMKALINPGLNEKETKKSDNLPMEEEIKGQENSGTKEKAGRKSKNYKHDGKENKINYFFNPLIPREDNKEKLLEYLKNKNQKREEALKSLPGMIPASGERKTKELDPSMIETELTRRDFMQNKSETPFGNIYRNYIQGAGLYQDQSDSQNYPQQTGLYPDKSKEIMTGKVHSNFPDYRQIHGIKSADSPEGTGAPSGITAKNYEEIAKSMSPAEVEQKLKKTEENLEDLYHFNKGNWYEISDESKKSLKAEWEKDIRFNKGAMDRLGKKISTENMATLKELADARKDNGYSKEEIGKMLSEKGFKKEDINTITDIAYKETYRNKLSIINSTDRLYRLGTLENRLNEKELELVTKSSKEITSTGMADEVAKLQQEKNDPTLSEEKKKSIEAQYKKAEEKLTYIQDNEKKVQTGISKKEQEYIGLRQADSKNKGINTAEIPSTLLESAKQKYKEANNGQEPAPQYIEDLKKKYSMVDSMYVADVGTDKNKTEDIAKSQETKLAIAMDSRTEDLERFKMSGKAINKNDPANAVNDIKNVSATYMDESRKNCEKDAKEALVARESLDKVNSEINELKQKGATDPASKQKLAELQAQQSKLEQTCTTAESKAKQSYDSMMAQLPEGQKEELRKKEEALAISSQELYKLNTEGKKKEAEEYNNYMIDGKVKYTELTDKLASLDKNSEEYKKIGLELDSFKKEMDGRVKAHNDFEDTFYNKEQEVISLRKELDGKRKEYGVGLNLVDLQESYKVNDKTLEGLKGQLSDSDKFKADDKIKFVESLKNNDFSKESLTNILKEKGFSDNEIEIISKNSNPSTYASEKKAEAVKGMYTGMVPPGTSSFEDIMAEAKVTKELANSKIAWTELEDAKKIGTTITVTSDITSMGGESNNVKGFALGTKIVLAKDAPAGTAIHETGHIMDNYGIMDVDYKVQQLYNNKKESGGDFATAYSAENKKEYFAEGLKLYSSPEGKQILETKDRDLYSMLQNLEKQGKLSEAKDILEQAGKARDNVGTILGQAGEGTQTATDTLTDKLSKVSIWQLNQENSAGLLNKLDTIKSELKLSDEEYNSIKSSLEKDKVISEESLNKLGLKQEEIDTLKNSSKKMDLTNNIFTAGLLNELKEGPKKEREEAINNYDTVKKFEELQKKNPELYDYLSDKKDLTEDTLKNNMAQGKEAYGNTKLFEYMNSLEEKNKEKPKESTLKDDLTNGMKSYYDADPRKKEELKQNNPKLYAYVEELEKNGIKTSDEALKDTGKLMESYDKRLSLKDKDPKLYACLEQMEKKGQLTGDMSKLSEEMSNDFLTYKKGSELKNNNNELYTCLSDLQNGKEVKSDDPAKGIYTYMSKLDKDGKLYKEGAINKDYIQNEIDLYSDKSKSKYLYENSPELFDYLLNQEKTQNEKFSEKLKNYKNTCTWLSDKPFVKEQAGNAIKLLEAAGNDIKTIDEASRYSLSEYRDAKLLNKEEKSREQVKDKTENILGGWRNISIDKDKLNKLDNLKDVTWYSYDDKNMEKLKGKIPADTLEKIKPLINNKMLTTEELQETLKNKNFNLKDEDIQTIIKNGTASRIGTEKLEQVKKDIGNKTMSRDELIRNLQNSGLSKEQAARAAKEIGMSEKDFIEGNKSTKKTNPEITVDDKLIKNFDQMTAQLKGKIPQEKLNLLKQELEKNKGKTMSLEEGLKLLDKYNFTKEEKSLLLKRMYPNLPDNYEIPDTSNPGNTTGSNTWPGNTWKPGTWQPKPAEQTWKPYTIWNNDKEVKKTKEEKNSEQPVQEGQGHEHIEELTTPDIKLDTSILSGMSEETRKSLEEANKLCSKDFNKTLGLKEDIDKLTKEMSGLKEGDPKLAELKSKRQELQLKYESSLKETKQEYQKLVSMLPEVQRKELKQREKKVATSGAELSRLHEQKEKENKNYSTDMNSFRQERQELQNRLKSLEPKSEEYKAIKQNLNNLESRIDSRVQEHNRLEHALHSKEKENIHYRQELDAKRQEFGVSLNINRQLTPEQMKKAKIVEGMYAGTVPKAGSVVEDMLTKASVTKELAKSSISIKELEEAKNIGTTITVASKEKGIISLGGNEKGTQGFVQGTRIVLAERAVTGTATHEMAHIMDKSKIMMEDNIRVGDRVINVGDRVQELYEEKKKSGGFANDYSGTNKQEYFAEGMRLYNSEEGRKELQTKDPKLFEVMKTLESDGKIETLKSNLDKTGEAFNLESYNDGQKKADMEKNYPGTVKYLDYMKEHEPEKFNNLRLSDNEGVKRIKEDIATGKFKGTEGEIAEAITSYRDTSKMEQLKQSRPDVYNYVQDLAGKGDLEKIQKGLYVKQELAQKLEQFNGPGREKLKESDPITFNMLEEMDKHGKLEDFSLTMKSSDTDLLKSAFKKEEVKTRETVQVKTSDILNNWDKNPKEKIAATLGTEKDYFVVNEGKHS
ncbi:MAG: hypothetical protein ABRQ38_14375, partial [Candidatus Eremiobacterota bacterium]